jgi:hypothetical protein
LQKLKWISESKKFAVDTFVEPAEAVAQKLEEENCGFRSHRTPDNF